MQLQKFINLINEVISISDKKKVKVHMVAAGAVIYKIGENGEKMILLIQRSHEDHWPDFWEFPRGKCDKPVGESPEKCVIREVKEEVGLDVVIEKFIDKFVYLADNGTRETVCYNFLCRLKDPNQKVTIRVTPDSGIKEHQAFRWFTEAGPAGLMVMPEQRKTIEKVLSTENPIVNNPDNTFTTNEKIEEKLNYYLKKIRGV